MASPKKNLKLPPAVGVFAALFTPIAPPEGSNDMTPRYTVQLRYPKKDAEKVLRPLREAIREVATAKWGAEKGARVAEHAKNPLIRDGDEMDQPSVKGCLVVRASTKATPTRKPPVVVDRRVHPVTSDDDAYSGCTFIAHVTVKPYAKGGNEGVTAYLNMVQVVEKGERLDGRPSASDEFEELEDEAGSAADDMM